MTNDDARKLLRRVITQVYPKKGWFICVAGSAHDENFGLKVYFLIESEDGKTHVIESRYITFVDYN